MTPLVPGMIIVRCSGSVSQAVARLESAVRARGMSIFAQIDHSAAAKAVGLDLRPTTLVVFGDPKIGTRIMQSAQTAGFDLPLKALVWTDGEHETWFGYTDTRALALHHAIPVDATVAAIAHALVTLAADVTGNDGAQ